MKLRIPRPHTRVSQGESAFAAGNARWTNLDLDPIAKNARKWGVSSIIGTALVLIFGKHQTRANRTYR
jgi:NCS1 family nucleobase:cation symporter-1